MNTSGSLSCNYERKNFYKNKIISLTFYIILKFVFQNKLFPHSIFPHSTPPKFYSTKFYPPPKFHHKVPPQKNVIPNKFHPSKISPHKNLPLTKFHPSPSTPHKILPHKNSTRQIFTPEMFTSLFIGGRLGG